MIDFEKEYEKMRPYRDDEAVAALDRIIDRPEMEVMLKYVYPHRSVKESKSELKKVRSVYDFQMFFSGPAVVAVLKKTASTFSFSGLENIKKNVPYLFISNHRDIVLDSAILQYILISNGYNTSQITFGSNLMNNSFFVDLGKINKMFTFYRGGSRLDTYKHALIHSYYIKRVITQEKESIWIAQSNGRTKNGDDKTQISLLKMFTIKEKDPVTALENLNIVPITVSYEIEPCDVLKVRETIISKRQKYVKAKGEDFHSILSGILGDKGLVHLAIGKPVNEFIKTNRSLLNSNDVHQKICEEMDRQIHNNYYLTKFNYVSYDLLNSREDFLGSKYTKEEQAQVIKYFDKKIEGHYGIDKQELKKGLIRLYAMPVVNYLETQEC